MKKINILISTIVLMLLTTTVNAQKIESYILKNQPQIVLDEGGPVVIEALKNTGTTMDAFGEDFAKSLSAYINSDNLGANKKGAKGKVYNSWYTTKLYDVSTDAAAAKYVIGGSYMFFGSVTESNDLKKVKETKKKDAITVFYYKNTVKASASVTGTLTVTRVSDGEIIKTFALKNNKSKLDSKNIDFPVKPTIDKYSKMVAKEEISKFSLVFSPVYSAKKYSFETLKGDKADKDYKKEMKNKKKVFKALAESGSVNELGKAYEALLANESKLKKPQDLYYNIGLCYELIGNYTKAKENYLKSAHKKAITEIDALITFQGMFTKIGLTTEEKEF